MKTVLLCILLFFVARAAIDYSTQDSFGSGTCLNAPSGSHKSPILIENSLCGPYGSFKISMQDFSGTPAFSGTFGAYAVDYTGGSLTYNTTTYTSTNILFRYKAEHILFAESGQADAEIQILMADGSNLAVLSFLVKVAGTDKGNQNAKNGFSPIQSITQSSWNFKLESLGNMVNERPANDQFLNMFRYEGTQTFPGCQPAVWFIYGGPLFVDNLDAIIAAMPTDATAASVTLRNTNENSRTVSSTPLHNGGGGGPIVVERLCFSGYFENHLGDNYGLWFGIVIILLFFIVTLLMSDTPISDPDYRESCKTIHPLYSIWVVGNEIFTKKSRSALVLMTITIHALFSSTWYRVTYPELKSPNIIAYAVCSMVISWFYTYMLGNILRGYYYAKFDYCKTRDESYDQKAQNRIFAYYTAVFATICIAWPFTVWNMGELRPETDIKASNYWVATFFVGLGLEFLLCDIIIAVLAKSSKLCRNFIRRKGYMYDDMCHETYMNALKMD